MLNFHTLIAYLTAVSSISHALCYNCQPSIAIFNTQRCSKLLPTTFHRYNSQSRRSAILSSSSDDASKDAIDTPVVVAIPVISLKTKLSNDMKDAMRAKDKLKLSAVRSIQTAIKQREVDERIEVTDAMVIEIMSKLIKQRKESIKSYIEGKREDLVEAEQAECDAISNYMPKQLTSEEIEARVAVAITELNATSVKDMGKVMNILRPSLVGIADISEVGDLVKKKLSSK